MKIDNIEMDDDVYRDRTIKKWKPILQIIPIAVEYWEDVSMFCEKHCNTNSDHSFNEFPMTLKLIGKLDLSKVMFTDFKEICKPYKLFISVTLEQIQDIQAQIGIDVMTMLESSMIEQMAIDLNKMIIDEGGVIIGDSFNVRLVTIDASENRLEMSGYVLSYDVYRYKKLKKMKLIINEKRKDNSSI